MGYESTLVPKDGYGAAAFIDHNGAHQLLCAHAVGEAPPTRLFIGGPGIGIVPEGATIIAAILYLRGVGAYQSARLEAYRISEDWDEANETPPAVDAGAVLAYDDADAQSAWQIDLTALAQQWQSGALPEYGVALESAS